MRRTTTLAAAAALVAASVVIAPVSPAAGVTDSRCANRTNDTIAKLIACVKLAGVREHQAALQEIADANNGIRASGTPGYDASVDYAVDVFEDAGYQVTVQPFEFFASIRVGPSVLQQVAPGSVTYQELVDFQAFDQSDAGDVTAAVTPIDIQLGLGNTSTSGCEAGDFAGFPAGNIALIQRGTCTFELKAENAAAAGAVGVILFNQGNTADRTGLIGGTLTAGNTSGIPVMNATYGLGAQLTATPGLTMRLFANVFRGEAETSNVFAETRSGNDNNVVMVGAHLDSVDTGPGINDNGSGVAAILETAQQMAKVNPRNTVRFALWGAEEAGLVGSDHYVFGLSDEQRAKIALYLNFDMIGSPNYVRFVYDGDGSEFGLAGPPGSAPIERYFTNFYANRGLASEQTEISFRSDYAAFFDSGIPFGGLFTGAEVLKTPQQAATFGGTAGVAYDPCYHQACDTYANNSNEVLDVNSDAVAASTLTYAMNTSSVNSLKGKGNFKPPRHDDELLPTS